MKSARSIKSALLTAFALSATAAAQEPAPIEAFARLPYFRSVSVSSDGEGLAARVASDGQELTVVFALRPDGLTPLYTTADADGYRVNWIEWKSPERLLMSLRFATKRYGTETVETRLMSLRPDGSDMQSVIKNKSDELPVQIQDRIISWLPDDPDHVLLQYSRTDPEHPSVLREPLGRGYPKTAQGARKPISHWYADRTGVVRGGLGFAGKSDDRAVLIIRMRDEEKYRDISHRVADDAPKFWIAGFTPDGVGAYVVSGHEADPAALYAYDIETDTFSERIFSHPEFDIEGIETDPLTGEAIGVSLSGTEDIETIWFDKEVRNLIASTQRALGGDRVSLVNWSNNGQFMVMFAKPRVAPGGYLIFDRSTNTYAQLTIQYPELTGYAIGDIHALTYEARDGLEIPAFLTLPAGVSLSSAKNLPFVVHPHGGPVARDFVGFDYFTQFLVSRGYGVLQTNFRGSDGFGSDFKAAGEGEAGKAMITDITDGARWLIERGVADPDRLAIVGASYGGYAAMMSLVQEPELYRCAVGINGLYDVLGEIRDADNYISGSRTQRYLKRLFGERRELKDVSPVAQAKSINKPVLLIHGEKDRTVFVDQARLMRRRLERDLVTYVELKNGDHYLSSYPNRLKALLETESFLARCLG